MNRRDSMAAHSKAQGKVAGVFPGRYPREVLEAMGILPVEIWDPPNPPHKAAAHLQPFVCSVAQRGLELVLQDKAIVDMLLFPHLCDTMQNLFTIVRDILGTPLPCHTFYTVRNQSTAAALAYVAEQSRALARAMQPLAGAPCTEERLATAIEDARAATEGLNGIYRARADGRWNGTNQAFYAMVRQREFLSSRALAATLNEALRCNQSAPQDEHSVRLVVSGVLPDQSFLRLLDERRVVVAEDDYLACGRRFLRASRPDNPMPPFETVAWEQLHLPPCSTTASPVEQRLEFIVGLVRHSRAAGVLFHNVKFCEPELFDHPFLVQGLKQLQIPSMILESELHQQHAGQFETRLDAFLEMI